jgi:hypothetical protein
MLYLYGYLHGINPAKYPADENIGSYWVQKNRGEVPTHRQHFSDFLECPRGRRFGGRNIGDDER